MKESGFSQRPGDQSQAHIPLLIHCRLLSQEARADTQTQAQTHTTHTDTAHMKLFYYFFFVI